MFKNKKALVGLFLLGIFYTSFSVKAEILFKEDFNAQPDWQNDCERFNCGCVEEDCIENELPGWDFWNLDEMWNPSTDNDNSRPQLSISSENARSGKALTIAPEFHRGRSGDSWGSDGMIGTHFPGTKEIWVSIWMLRQDGFSWHDDGERGAGIKTLRIECDDGTRPFNFSFSESTVPMYLYKYGHKSLYNINDTHDHSPRCSEKDPHYMCDGNYSDLARGQGYTINPEDGLWHEYVYHLKLNSAVGVADGVLEHYLDGELERSQYDIEWEMSSDGSEKFFNFLALGGNVQNGSFSRFPPDRLEDIIGDEGEGWYSIDDVCVATTEADLVNCFAPTEIRADVDQNSLINSADAMLTLRNSLGLDMSSTNWHTSATTGDVNCDSTSNSTDAMLILRHSLGLSDGAGWCGN